MGVPVPPGFTITADMNLYFYKNERKLPGFFQEQIRKDIQVLEAKNRPRFWFSAETSSL